MSPGKQIKSQHIRAKHERYLVLHSDYPPLSNCAIVCRRLRTLSKICHLRGANRFRSVVWSWSKNFSRSDADRKLRLAKTTRFTVDVTMYRTVYRTISPRGQADSMTRYIDKRSHRSQLLCKRSPRILLVDYWRAVPYWRSSYQVNDMTARQLIRRQYKD